MTFSQALQIVGSRYVPGVVRYYARMTPDPWQAVHDDVEKLHSIKDTEMQNLLLERFVDRCTDLIERFKRETGSSPSISPADALALGSEKAIHAHLSRKHKRCASCDTKEGLKIVPVHPGSMDVMLVCAGCAVKGKSA